MRGVIDRMTDQNKAVILIESTKEELVISQDELPQGAQAQDWVILKREAETYKVIAIDEQQTKQQAEKIQSLQEKLRARSRGSKFKRK